MLMLLLIASVVLFLYPFALYPAVLRLLPRWRTKRRAAASQEFPSVALVICALNEQNIIRRKVENCLNLNYPKDLLRIVLVSDGSTDATAAIVKEYHDAGVELIERQARRGKIANLNEVVPMMRSDIVALSDANVLYDRDALLRLVERFRDPEVGCVSGKVILTGSSPELNAPTDSYYSVEWFLQERASEVYSMIEADGAMYALRRELYSPCPNDTIIEDFIIPMGVVRQGKRVVFEPDAIGWEQGATSLREEFRRKVRIAAGSAQGMLRGNAWPSGAPARFWFIFVSHKLLRWLSPLLGLTALSLAAASLDQSGSRLLMAAFLGLGTLAAMRMLTGWTHLVVSAPFYFLFGQAALATGLFKGILGRQTVLWAKADR